MSSLIIKFTIYPLVVYLAGFFLNSVQFISLFQPFLIGFILAVAATLMELYLLKPGTLWLSTGLDFLASTAIVYIVPFFLAGAYVTLTGAIITGFVLALTEIPQHLWLNRTGNTIKDTEQEQIE